MLTIGTLLAGACLAVGMLLALIVPRRSDAGGELTALLDSLLALDAWGWSMLGALLLMATPAAGLLVTATELREAQPGAALLALVVLGVLGVAVLVALA